MGTQHVLVAGGGPAGFITALGLARSGIRVTLVESASGISDSPRAMVYHWTVLEGLDRLGILEDAVAKGFTKNDYCHIVYRTDERIHWNVDALAATTKYPYNLHLGQNDLAEIAYEHLARIPGNEVHFSTRITDLAQDEDGVTVTLTGDNGARQERFDWVIGADGAASTVREKLLKLNFFGITWPERFISTNVRVDLESHGYARANFLMDDVHGAIIAKIDTTDLWRITFMEDVNLPLDTMHERIHNFYTKHVRGIGPNDYELVQYSPYRMHQRCSDSMRVGRVMLVGDAAHITNPTGGLGLTSGLFDSYFLVEVMNLIINEGASHDLLDRYSNERRQAFLERASPQAVRNKELIFHAHEGTWLDRQLDHLRSLADNPDRVVQQVQFTKTLQSTL